MNQFLRIAGADAPGIFLLVLPRMHRGPDRSPVFARCLTLRARYLFDFGLRNALP